MLSEYDNWLHFLLIVWVISEAGCAVVFPFLFFFLFNCFHLNVAACISVACKSRSGRVVTVIISEHLSPGAFLSGGSRHKLLLNCVESTLKEMNSSICSN